MTSNNFDPFTSNNSATTLTQSFQRLARAAADPEPDDDRGDRGSRRIADVRLV